MSVEAIADDLEWWEQARVVAYAALHKVDPPPENHLPALRELEAAGEWGVIIRYFWFLANDLDNRYHAGLDRSYGDTAAAAREAPLLEIYASALTAATPRFAGVAGERSFRGVTGSPAPWIERIGKQSGSATHLRVAGQLMAIQDGLDISD